jgi:predicted transglutaminase-like cysteine proteinase
MIGRLTVWPDPNASCSVGGDVARCVGLLLAIPIAGTLVTTGAEARGRPSRASDFPMLITNASPALAPFQHVRFCLRYPSDCTARPADTDRVGVSDDILELLKRINQNVNRVIIPKTKQYGANLADSWSIAPHTGDCNDYAVTKRHQLIEQGLPSNALRLSVVKTQAGLGHLVLVVATIDGDLVLDNLTDAILDWRSTRYHWLKIQSAIDPQSWYEIRTTDELGRSPAGS